MTNPKSKSRVYYFHRMIEIRRTRRKIDKMNYALGDGYLYGDYTPTEILDDRTDTDVESGGEEL